MKQLLAITEGPDFVCYRYRLAAFSDALAARDWQLAVLPLARSWTDFLKQLSTISRAEAVVLQRRLCGWTRRRLIRRAARTLIYDFDDAMFFRDSNARKTPRDPVRWRRFRQTVRTADLCLAGNDYLRQQAADCAGVARVHRVPTCVDPAQYISAAHARRDGDVQLVWIGSRSTAPSLIDAGPGLAAATRQLPGLTLRAISDAYPRLDGVNLLPTPWASETEAALLAQADIGIAWLPEHPWSLGKCGLKVLQYMAAGLPVIANPVGVHCEIIKHGQTGYLASQPDEWCAAIRELAGSPELRRRMGRAGRARVQHDYNVQHWGPRLAELVEQAHGGVWPHSAEARAA
jgi:glycosyltransferase involved in cell wall biosynthesis